METATGRFNLFDAFALWRRIRTNDVPWERSHGTNETFKKTKSISCRVALELFRGFHSPDFALCGAFWHIISDGVNFPVAFRDFCSKFCAFDANICKKDEISHEDLQPLFVFMNILDLLDFNDVLNAYFDYLKKSWPVGL